MTAARKGATRATDIPADVLQALSRGEMQSATLAECMALNQAQLMRVVFPGLSLKALKEVPPAIQAKLAANMQLMEDLELQATPAIFYMDDKGELQQQQGAPSPDKLVKILGPK